MIQLGPEPKGLLLRRADVFAWLPGLSREEWRKFSAALEPVRVPGCKRPYFRKSEIRAKLVKPMEEQLTR